MTVKYGLLAGADGCGALRSPRSEPPTHCWPGSWCCRPLRPPPSVSILQVRAYGGDEQKVGTVMLLSYILCVFSMPVWLAVWEMAAG